ncbi:MAG TPA: putative quinol monooxygenase [Acidobacteriota bacterium]|nr:putative quinol monooxygenase [Acidobacteriota bacterium]
MSLCVIAHIRARQGRQEELRKLLTGLVGPTRKEAGCIRYQLYRNNVDPQDFTFVEEWESDASLDTHLKKPHLQAAFAAFSDLVDGTPAVNRYSLIA